VIRSVKDIFNQHLILVIAIAITLVIYSKFLFFGHISWDDPEMVFKNKAVQNFDLKAFFTNHYVGNYIPVTMLTHSIAWFLFENNDGGHHLINILIHIINGILVYNIAKRIFKNHNFSNIIVVIFLLHPLQLESVGWIGELKNVLSSCFYLAAILNYLNYSETKKQKHYFYTLLFFILGCMSKSSVVVLPLALLCIDIFLNKNFSLKYILNKLPLLVLSVVFGLINLKTQAADQFINYSHAFPYHERLGYAGFAIAKYIQQFLLPYHLSVLYPYPENKVLAMSVGYLIAGIILFFIFYLVKRKNWTLISLIMLCIINLALVLQFIPFGEVLYADRYMYLPLIFFSLLFLELISKITSGVIAAQKIILYTVIIIFPVLTFLRVPVWKSSSVLYADILKKFPDSFVALNSLGVELMFQNDDKKALEYLNKAVAVAPKNYKGYYNRGLLLIKNNQPEEAIKSFNSALEIYDYRKAYIGRASAYYMLKDIPKAMRDAEHVLLSEPNNAKARFVIANCYNDLNKLDEALREYNKCIQINPEDADFYFKRAIVYGKKQDFIKCLNDLTVCLEFNPTYFEAYYWRGVAKINVKQNPCEDLKIAARNNVAGAMNTFNKYCK